MGGGAGKVCSSRLLEVLFQGVLGQGTTVSAWISLHSECDSASLLRTLQRLLGRVRVQLHSLAQAGPACLNLLCCPSSDLSPSLANFSHPGAKFHWGSDCEGSLVRTFPKSRGLSRLEPREPPLGRCPNLLWIVEPSCRSASHVAPDTQQRDKEGCSEINGPVSAHTSHL